MQVNNSFLRGPQARDQCLCPRHDSAGADLVVEAGVSVVGGVGLALLVPTLVEAGLAEEQLPAPPQPPHAPLSKAFHLRQEGGESQTRTLGVLVAHLRHQPSSGNLVQGNAGALQNASDHMCMPRINACADGVLMPLLS
jgi:hypothetical protein